VPQARGVTGLWPGKLLVYHELHTHNFSGQWAYGLHLLQANSQRNGNSRKPTEFQLCKVLQLIPLNYAYQGYCFIHAFATVVTVLINTY